MASFKMLRPVVACLASSSPRDALLASVEASIIPEGAELKDTVTKDKKDDGGDAFGPIQPAVAHATGDRGNIHYAKELDKGIRFCFSTPAQRFICIVYICTFI